MMKTKSQLGRAVRAAAAISLLPAAMQVSALEYTISDDLNVNIDTQLTYGRMYRVEGRDKGLLTYGDMGTSLTSGQFNQAFKEVVQRTNADDGTRNYDKWDVVSSRYSIVSDIKIAYKNVGLFVRPQIFYDEVPFEGSSWDCKYACDPSLYAPGYENGRGILNNWGPWFTHEINQSGHFGDDYKEVMGYEARFLDAYVYGNFAIGDSTLDVRIGRQVISWGEALMLQGGIAFAQNRNDAAAATAPGVELKEIFLPTGAVYGSINATEQLTVEAYWMYEFIPSTLFPTGSYWNTQDFITGDTFWTHAAGSLGSGYMSRRTTREPDNDKQFGLGLRYLLGEGTEAAFYLVNYHDKYPMFWAFNGTGNYDGFDGKLDADHPYSISYFDNIRMYAMTLNTVIGNVQTGIEYAYRANAPIVPACTEQQMKALTCKDPFYYALAFDRGQLPFYPSKGVENALVSWPTRAEVHTLNMGITYIPQPTPLWDAATLVAELGTWYIGGFENENLQFAHLGAFTKQGAGMSAQFMPEYKNVFEGVDLVIPFFVNYGIEGSMSTFNFNEKSLWWSIGAEFTYLENWRFAAYYNNFSGPNNLWVDRDNINFNIKYNF